jgi:hypothetical protein
MNNDRVIWIGVGLCIGAGLCAITGVIVAWKSRKGPPDQIELLRQQERNIDASSLYDRD